MMCRFVVLFTSPYSKIGITWVQEKKIKHQLYNKPGEVTIHGIKVQYQHPVELIHALKEIFFGEIYKFRTRNEQPVIIDCGANIGLSTISFKLQYPQAEIIAFEPDIFNFELLKINTTSFANITLFNQAIWDKEELLEFDMSGTMSSNTDTAFQSKKSQTIQAVPLKTFLNRKIDFLKLDIEGAEYRVIKDCIDELKNVQNFFIEYHGYFDNTKELNELFDILIQSGFMYYIKEADNIYANPFYITKRRTFDLQLNIFAFRDIPPK